MHPYNLDDKENYNSDLKNISPKRLIHHKRYKVLKEIVRKSVLNKMEYLTDKQADIPKNTNYDDEIKDEADNCYPALEFVDESTKRYGM